MIKDLARIIFDNYEYILDHISFGIKVMDKKLIGAPDMGKFNWQSYVLTPLPTLIAKSGYKVYTHVQGIKLPKLSNSMSEKVKKCIPGWCNTSCDPKYRKRCLEKETETEIDAFVFPNEKEACVIEHASEIRGLCGDMVKVYKLITPRKGFSSCLFLTWVNTNSEDHAEYAEVTTRLGKMLFDDLIGKENWSKIYITYEGKNHERPREVFLSLGGEIGGVPIQYRHLHPVVVKSIEKEIFED